jgi:hypothetical protein
MGLRQRRRLEAVEAEVCSLQREARGRATRTLFQTVMATEEGRRAFHRAAGTKPVADGPGGRTEEPPEGRAPAEVATEAPGVASEGPAAADGPAAPGAAAATPAPPAAATTAAQEARRRAADAARPAGEAGWTAARQAEALRRYHARAAAAEADYPLPPAGPPLVRGPQW